jgi:exosortase/archaeosortase family protein
MIGLDAESNTIRVGGSSFLINESCTGLVSIMILASTIFALRKPGLNKKIRMFFAGSIALFFLNIARVSLVLLVALQSIQAAELTHVISWFLMSAAIIALWYYSTKRMVKIKRFNELI